MIGKINESSYKGFKYGFNVGCSASTMLFIDEICKHCKALCNLDIYFMRYHRYAYLFDNLPSLGGRTTVYSLYLLSFLDKNLEKFIHATALMVISSALIGGSLGLCYGVGKELYTFFSAEKIVPEVDETFNESEQKTVAFQEGIMN